MIHTNPTALTALASDPSVSHLDQETSPLRGPHRAADTVRRHEPRVGAQGMRETRLNARVTSAAGFLRWARGAGFGEWCIYHEGNLALDRTEDRDLHERAEAVLILSSHGFVAASQGRPPHADSGVLAYMATRTGRGRAPRAILSGEVAATDFGALKAVQGREVQQSAHRAIRDRLGLSEGAADGLLRRLADLGLVERGTGYKAGWALTPVGQQALL